MPQLNFLQRALSLLVPVRVFSTQSPQHKQLDLLRYQGRWQLSTEDAYYSDGAAYTPLRKAFGALRKEISGWKDVLVLGAGLGSAVWVLDKKHRARPQLTLVDLDEEILTIAADILADEGHADHVELICEDAEQYVELEERTFDCVVIDIFRGRKVPDFALQPLFLSQCLALLRPKGYLVLNFIINQPEEWNSLEKTLQSVMPGHEVLAHGINRIVLFCRP